MHLRRHLTTEETASTHKVPHAQPGREVPETTSPACTQPVRLSRAPRAPTSQRDPAAVARPVSVEPHRPAMSWRTRGGRGGGRRTEGPARHAPVVLGRQPPAGPPPVRARCRPDAVAGSGAPRSRRFRRHAPEPACMAAESCAPELAPEPALQNSFTHPVDELEPLGSDRARSGKTTVPGVPRGAARRQQVPTDWECIPMTAGPRRNQWARSDGPS